MVEQPLEERWRSGKHGHSLLLNEREHAFGFVDRNWQVDRAKEQADDDPAVVAERMEVRIDEQIWIAWLNGESPAVVDEHTNDRAAPHKHPLGVSGGARSEHDESDIGWRDRGGAGIDLGLKRLIVAVGAKRCEWHRPLARAVSKIDDRLERWDVFVSERGAVVGIEEAIGHKQQARRRRVEYVGGLVAFEPRVDRNHDGAGPRDGQGSNDPLPTVGRPHPNPITGLDAVRDERSSRLIDAHAKLLIGQGRIAVTNRGSLSPGRHRPANQLGYRRRHWIDALKLGQRTL